MGEVRVLGPNGSIGTGFREGSFERGLSLNPHVIACDGGTTDAGPSFLGSGDTHFSRHATKRDLRLMLLGREKLEIPLIVGSCGSAGGNIGVDWMYDIALEVAKEEGLNFRLALIRSEQDKGYLKNKLKEGKIKPLKPAPEISEGVIDRSAHIVGMMGREPINEALEEGAEVILTGRASDTSVFASVPIHMGALPGPSWHAAKILECGTACVTQRKRPDSIFARIQDDDFVIEPLDPDLRCTPQSVASHSLYENVDPYLITEPGGIIDSTESKYTVESNSSVRVSGSQFRESPTYSIKLEGSEYVGYQYIVIGGVRDPYIIRQVDSWILQLEEKFQDRVEELFSGQVGVEDYTLLVRVYGKNAVMGSLEPVRNTTPHEIALVFEITAADKDTAKSLAQTFSHFAVHFPIPEWHGLISGLAFPYAPAELEKGEVFRFNLNHVVLPDTPYEMFPMEMVEV